MRKDVPNISWIEINFSMLMKSFFYLKKEEERRWNQWVASLSGSKRPLRWRRKDRKCDSSTHRFSLQLVGAAGSSQQQPRGSEWKLFFSRRQAVRIVWLHKPDIHHIHRARSLLIAEREAGLFPPDSCTSPSPLASPFRTVDFFFVFILLFYFFCTSPPAFFIDSYSVAHSGFSVLLTW